MITLVNPPDVNGDGSVTAGDALQVINRLSVSRSPTREQTALIAFDTNLDGDVTAADALFVINRLSKDVNAAQVTASTSGGEDDDSTAIDRLLTDDAFLSGLF